jgi:hypothetical protein
MICPVCKSDNEMAYSVFLSGFVCFEPECGFELEMGSEDAQSILATEEDLVLA